MQSNSNSNRFENLKCNSNSNRWQCNSNSNSNRLPVIDPIPGGFSANLCRTGNTATVNTALVFRYLNVHSVITILPKVRNKAH